MTRKIARTTRSLGLATRRDLGLATQRAAIGVLSATLLTLAAPNGIALGLSAPAAAGSAAPPAASEYRTLPVCHAPSPGHASCLALALAPRTAAARLRMHQLARVHSAAIGTASPTACTQVFPACLTPQNLNDAYFPGEKPEAPGSEPQTIALVDAYNDPNIEGDLKVYDEAFGLPACTEANGCFKKVNQKGEVGRPPTTKGEAEKEEAEGWALEISTDVEAAHAVCQNCHIELVEANDSAYANLVTAEETAVQIAGVGEISNSWGGPEAELTNPEIAAFNHPGIVITASAGDDGYLNWDLWKTEPLNFDEPDFPASSPDVVAVGGTRLTLSSSGTWGGESVWNDDQEGSGEGASGGGCSLRFGAQAWQRDTPDWPAVGCEDRRAVADVSADADPDSGVAVYDSVPYPYEEAGKAKVEAPRWLPIGGTSLASPIIAAMFALAGGAHGVAYPAQTLYSHLSSAALHDVAPQAGISAGGNGECDDEYSSCSGSMKPLSPFDCGEGALICNAAVGYDGPTGVGTPSGLGAFKTTTAAGGTGGSPESKSGSGGSSQLETGTSSNPQNTETQGPSESSLQAPNTPTITTPNGATTTIRLSDLTLTAGAIAAIRHGHRSLARLAFAFTLSAASRVRFTLMRQQRIRGHRRWVSEPDSLTFSATAGRNHLRLRGRVTLPTGRYRVTLAPTRGQSQSLTFLLVEPV